MTCPSCGSEHYYIAPEGEFEECVNHRCVNHRFVQNGGCEQCNKIDVDRFTRFDEVA